jgi:uncharacterized protein YcbK (DUF882 family)
MVRRGARLAPALFFGVLALASVTVLSRADAALGPVAPKREARPLVPRVTLAATAQGISRAVRMLTALPGRVVAVPLELSGRPAGLSYQWLDVGSMVSTGAPQPLAGPILAPEEPGFYRLAVVREGQQRVVDSLTLGVLKPLTEKRGASINGYRIGFYRGERRGDAVGAPEGFLEVLEHDAALSVSQHLSLSDFLAHDSQTTWPRYVAVDPRLLDKLELVFEEIVRMRGGDGETIGNVDVHSGFRTPLHNRRIVRAASDSRHQYGDAADIAVDANEDGRISVADLSLIVRAVEAVERRHPELLGGLGIYRGGSAYAHIDVRGHSVRWQG